MLTEEFEYYIDNQSELIKKYENKFLIIKDKSILGAYDSFEEALKQSQKKKLIPGTYLIQHCTPGEESYTQTFHSRVIFA